MKQIRLGAFETNSSSTHTLIITSGETYDKWLKGKVLYNDWENTFMDVDVSDEEIEKEAIELYNSMKLGYWKDWEDVDESSKRPFKEKALKNLALVDGLTYDEFCADGDVCDDSYITPSGEKVVSIAVYKYD